jgi:putative Mg2+ transporter-C (MgtC) family protein
MTLYVSWEQIALRIALACLASLAIGYNRDEHGRPAGMRTVMLVTLTATLAMLQVNLLLPLRGKAPDSFNVMDLMRLPLGILSGIGFIGAGAIIKKDSKAIGVTTAATLWFSTMLGLLFGGGQVRLACVATILALLILTALRYVEKWMPRAHRGVLTLTFVESSQQEKEIVEKIQASGCKINGLTVRYDPPNTLTYLQCEIKWQANERIGVRTPEGLRSLQSLPALTDFHWQQAE